MCNPLAIASLVLTAAGTYAQSQGQRKANEAMDAAARAESARQKALRDEANTLFNKSLGEQGSDAQTERLADKIAERDAAMVGNQVSDQVVNVPVQGGAPAIVADETAARVGVGNAKARDEAAAKAAIAAFGDLQLGNALANARYGQQQSQLANFMQGSQGVLPTELNAASHKGDKTKMFGDMLVSLGQVAGMASMGGGGSLFSNPNNPTGLTASTGLKSLGGTPISELAATTNVTSNPSFVYARPGALYANPVRVATPYPIPR